ncbi:MAG: hypothetical protein AAGB93_02405 [Planctomycetota bacterium]
MNRFWLEPLADPGRARPMSGAVRGTVDPGGSLLRVEVERLALEFWCLEEVDVALAYFRDPGGSTASDPAGGDHWEFQAWPSRLPAGHNAARRRARVLEALESARAACAADPTYRPALQAAQGDPR